MNQQLMIAVERAVRPVLAPNSRKLRMRQELLAHLEDIHAEEALRGGDEDAILRRALARFGDTAALTPELQQSVPRGERYEGWLNRWFLRRPGESPLRIALRITAASLLFVLVEFAVVELIQMLQGRFLPNDLPVIGMILLMFLMNVFALTWLAAVSADMALARAGQAWRQPRLWLAALAAGLLVGFSGLLILVVAGGGATPPPEAMQRWLALALLATFGFVAALQAVQWEYRRVAEWERLDLGDLA